METDAHANDSMTTTMTITVAAQICGSISGKWHEPCARTYSRVVVSVDNNDRWTMRCDDDATFRQLNDAYRRKYRTRTNPLLVHIDTNPVPDLIQNLGSELRRA
jgi:hypothetical protein